MATYPAYRTVVLAQVHVFAFLLLVVVYHLSIGLVPRFCACTYTRLIAYYYHSRACCCCCGRATRSPSCLLCRGFVVLFLWGVRLRASFVVQPLSWRFVKSMRVCGAYCIVPPLRCLRVLDLVIVLFGCDSASRVSKNV